MMRIPCMLATVLLLCDIIHVTGIQLRSEANLKEGENVILDQTSSTQRIARFPASLDEQLRALMKSIDRDGNGSCDVSAARKIVSACDGATFEESFACVIVSAPGSGSKFPFGLYPANLPLTTSLESIGLSSITPIFHECALIEMIYDECFALEVSTDQFMLNKLQYSDQSSYNKQVGEKYGMDSSANAGYGPIAVSASYSTTQDTSSSSSKNTLSAGLITQISQSVAKLTNACIGTRDGVKYFDPSKVREWKKLGDLAYLASKTQTRSLLSNTDFLRFASQGFVLPKQFNLGVSYDSSIQMSYEESTSAAKSSASNSISAGVEATSGLFKVGGSYSQTSAISNANAASDLHATVTSKFYTYGPCDFEKELQEANNLRACADKVADDLTQLSRPISVTNGGFVTMGTILQTLDIQVVGVIQAALNEYYTTCSCATPWVNTYVSGSNFFTCVSGDGRQKYLGSYMPAGTACTSSIFLPHQEGTNMFFFI